MEWAKLTESYKQACKDEMKMCLQQGATIYQTPDTFLPNLKPLNPLPHHVRALQIFWMILFGGGSSHWWHDALSLSSFSNEWLRNVIQVKK